MGTISWCIFDEDVIKGKNQLIFQFLYLYLYKQLLHLTMILAKLYFLKGENELLR